MSLAPKTTITADGIREVRRAMHWNQAQLARHLNVSPVSVNNWEMGRNAPDEYRSAVMLQLQSRAEGADAKQRAKLQEALRFALVTGGVFLLLKTLFDE